MPFFKRSGSENLAATPALMFRDLKKHPDIKFLGSHQEKILDAYHEQHLETPDLALELPTGAGKTLVGLLLAEHRMRSANRRAAFLCPTKQLAAQVHTASAKYGSSTVLLTGSQREWDQNEFLKYQLCKAVAVTTYSAIFNSNPKLDNVELLVCDDAHAADNFVNSMWTVAISHKDHPLQFEILRNALASHMTESMLNRIRRDERSASDADLISNISLRESHINLRELLDPIIQSLSDAKNLSTDARKPIYSYPQIIDHLDACNIYVSTAKFEISPVTPPTRYHGPFRNAKQRVYMSATLSDDGSIERSFGTSKITRLPVPKGWDVRGIGRRLVLFPDRETDAPLAFAHELAKSQPRTLVLVPSSYSNTKVRSLFEPTHTIISITDIEHSLSAFTSAATPAALIAANRFDGIDLRGDDCRFMIIMGLPDAAGLHEMYMIYRLGASAILRDRIRTRITQALGRCTREEGDYAVVMVIGDDLLKWFSTDVNTAAMHPELQAEIKFGFQVEPSEIRSAVDALMAQSQEWKDAEGEIAKLRSESVRVKDPEAEALYNAAAPEIEYQYSMWDGRHSDAVQYAQEAIDRLANGSLYRAYRSFWHHQKALAAYAAWKDIGRSEFRATCVEEIRRANQTSSGLRWLGRLQGALSTETGAPAEAFPVQLWYGQLSKLLSEWGLTGDKFNTRIQETLTRLHERDNTTSLEIGIENLGRMLGFRVKRYTTPGKPDGLWWIDDWKAFVFEAKFNASTDMASLEDVRQADAHERVIKHERDIPDVLACHTVFASDQPHLAVAARGLVAGKARVTHSTLLELFSAASQALSRVRAFAATRGGDDSADEAWRIYQARDITPIDVASRLLAVPLEASPSPTR